MTWLVQARLINDPFSDPGLFVDFRFGRRALLFDLGDLGALSSREILRVSHAFVSHTHMDHFAGFDRLLRLCLYRPGPLHVAGPPGLVASVEAKLDAYTWNLLTGESVDFSIVAADHSGESYVRRRIFRARDAFRGVEAEPPALPSGILLDEDEFRLETTLLDHGTACLAFALKEKLRVNVLRAGLEELGLPVGPWLNRAKRAVRLGLADETLIEVTPERTIALGLLKKTALSTAQGQRLAYVVDAAFHSDNVARIAGLAAAADQLFIEAAFLDADAPVAAAKRHLTARQAGAIARRAGAARATPLHFSTRYLGREAEIVAEFLEAFGGSTKPPDQPC